MDIRLEKLELIKQILSTESVEVINEVKALLNKEVRPTLTDAHYEILEERDAKLTDINEMLTWDEVKANARAAKN